MTSSIKLPAGDEIHIWRVALGAGGRAAARRALGELLADYLGTAEPPPLTADPQGKPRLDVAAGGGPEHRSGAGSPLAFNLSHSRELALIAVAPGGVEVGVDVERLRRRRDPARLAARWLSAVDAAAVAAAPAGEREEVFHRAWTRHEARVKCTGAGLSSPPPAEAIVARQLDVGPGYAAAVAFDLGVAAGREPRITLRDR